MALNNVHQWNQNQMKQFIAFSFSLFGLFACTENNISEDELLANDFRGAYSISSMTTELPLDLNNDEVQSINYLDEISLPYRLHNGEVVNYAFTPNNPRFHTIAKPHLEGENNTKYLEINLPEHDMSELFIGNDNFTKISLGVDRLHMTLIYKLVNGQVEIESDPMDFLAFNKVTDFSITRINTNSFEIKFRKNFYDFKEEKEINTGMRVVFERI